jgi:hypothetical protein
MITVFHEAKWSAEQFFKMFGHSDFPLGHKAVGGCELYEYAKMSRIFHQMEGDSEPWLDETFADWTWDQGEADLRSAARVVVAFERERPSCTVMVRRITINWTTNVTGAARALRDAHARGAVSDHVRIIMRSAPDFKWGFSAALWAEAEPVLDAIVAEYGIVIPPFHKRPARKRWVAQDIIDQAQEMRTIGELTSDVEHLFEAYPGWEWNPQQFRCTQFAAAFMEQFGDGGSKVKVDGLRRALGSRLRELASQRHTLTEPQTEMLERLPHFSWDPNEVILRLARLCLDAVEAYETGTATYARMSASVGHWFKDAGGREALEMAEAETEWRAGRAELPNVDPSSMDDLTLMLASSAALGHRKFESRLEETATRWKTYPMTVHPMIRNALPSIDGWAWSERAVGIQTEVAPANLSNENLVVITPDYSV